MPENPDENPDELTGVADGDQIPDSEEDVDQEPRPVVEGDET